MQTIAKPEHMSEEIASLVRQGVWGLFSIQHDKASFLLTTSSYCSGCNPTIQCLYLLKPDGEVYNTIEKFSDVHVVESLLVE